MVPDASAIARRRHTVRTIVRAVALGILILFLAPVAAGGVMLLASLLGIAPVWGDVILSRLLTGSGFLAVGVAMLLFEKRLVAWLVPIPRSRCPQCEYFLVSLVELRCPECGLPLTREFLDHPDGETHHPTAPLSGDMAGRGGGGRDGRR